MIERIVVIVLVAAIFPMSRLAAAGQTGAEFLRLGPGARGAALSGAQAALADDAFALYWNPAGLSQVRDARLSLTQERPLDGVRRQSLHVAAPLSRFGAAALGVDRLEVDPFDAFDARGAVAGRADAGAGVVSLAWAGELAGRGGPGGFSAGFSVKSLREEHAGVSASGFAADAGLLFRPWAGAAFLRRFSLGLVARHLGGGLRFDESSAPLPAEFAAGLGHASYFAGDTLSLALDARRPSGEPAHFAAGAEYWSRDLIAFRAGLRSGADGGAGFSAGAGVRLRRLEFDYAWTGRDAGLGDAHRFGVTWRFTGPAALPGAREEAFLYHAARGRSHFEAGHYDRAVLEYEAALKLRPGDAECLRGLLQAGERLEAAP